VTQAEIVPRDWKIIQAKLAAGQDLVFGMNLPSPFKPVGEVGAKYVPDSKTVGGAHIMVIAGYASLANGETYYLLRNSWGAKWGDDGYVWIHQATLDAHAGNRFAAIDAQPEGVADGGAPRRPHVPVMCPSGQVPDSITAACAPTCPDGSPRHDDVCAIAGQCDKGYVNLFGACVWAAPSTHGLDPKTNIGWWCGPGGCVYTVPKGVGGATGTSFASCPAPSFRLASDYEGLTCVE
jgi:hypothetical protein